jgi:hypothetical protein
MLCDPTRRLRIAEERPSESAGGATTIYSRVSCQGTENEHNSGNLTGPQLDCFHDDGEKERRLPTGAPVDGRDASAAIVLKPGELRQVQIAVLPPVQGSVDPGRGVDPLPDQPSYLLLARKQQRAGAEGEPVLGEFGGSLLLGPNPVGEQG